MSKFLEFKFEEVEEAIMYITDNSFETPEEAQEYRLKFKQKLKFLKTKKGAISIKTLIEIGEGLGYSLNLQYIKKT